MNDRLVRTASHWGAFWAKVRDGRAVGVEPFEKDEHPSPLAQSLVEAVYDKSRIDRPYVRKGFLDHGSKSDRTRRGAEPFVPVDWDTALALAAGELKRVKSALRQSLRSSPAPTAGRAPAGCITRSRCCTGS